jgi:hypothetical protein
MTPSTASIGVQGPASSEYSHRRNGEAASVASISSSTDAPARRGALTCNDGGVRSMHPDVTEPADRTPLKNIKLLPDDPVAVLPQIADIKKRYTAIFGN